MIMKKILLLVAASIMSIGAISAQNLSTEAIAGMNLSNWGGLGSKVGFHVGARVELALPSLAEGVYTNAGLLFTTKGCKMDWGDLGKANASAYYLELPIHIGYKYAVSDSFAIFGDAGPYVGFGLFGKLKSTYTDYDFYEDVYYTETETSDVFEDVNRFDVGVGLRVGVELNKKYSVSLSYDWGLLDSYKGDADDYEDYIDLTPSMKHTNLMISLGYKF